MIYRIDETRINNNPATDYTLIYRDVADNPQSPVWELKNNDDEAYEEGREAIRSFILNTEYEDDKYYLAYYNLV